MAKTLTTTNEAALWIKAGISPDLLSGFDFGVVCSPAGSSFTGRDVAETPATQSLGGVTDTYRNGVLVVKADPVAVAALRAKDIRDWRHCIQHIRINARAYEVTFDVDGLTDVSRPTCDGGRKQAECPNCFEDTDFAAFSDGTRDRIECRGCDASWPIVDGVPEEYR